MKRIFLTILLFITLNVGAQTELIDISKFIKLDDSLYKSENGKTIVLFDSKGYVVQCKGKIVDEAYVYAAENMNYKGEAMDSNGREFQVFENDEMIIEFYRHSTRLMAVTYK